MLHSHVRRAHKRHLPESKEMSTLPRELREFRCTRPRCSHTFRNQKLLDRHVEVYHTGVLAIVDNKIEGDRIFKCTWPNCNVRVRNEKYLEFHIQKHREGCFDEKDQAKMNERTDSSGSDTEEEKSDYVQQLNETVPEVEIKKELETDRKFYVRKRRVKLDESGQPRKVRKYNIKRGTYPCNFDGCRLVFTTRRGFQLHEASHRREKKPLACHKPNCAFISNDIMEFREHKASHRKERPYKCVWAGCGKSFILESRLKSHILIHI